MTIRSPTTNHILFAVLSAQPKDTRIPEIRDKLYGVLRNEKNPLIRRNFHFDGRRRYSQEIDQEITNMVTDELLILGRNDSHTIRFSQESPVYRRRTKNFSEEDLQYLQGLGEKLTTEP
jgi:hypothetical protein|tara:strand:+ start:77 stop:433 length:357 start_codon:yes stop_codon:yes gene_type:complete